jgi:hypothetical protein
MDRGAGGGGLLENVLDVDHVTPAVVTAVAAGAMRQLGFAAVRTQ